MANDNRRRRPSFWVLLWASLMGAAVVTELRKPAQERTWTGTVAGVVPYDLRPPTIARYRSRLWSPEDDRIIQPQAFGVGWTLNVGRLAALARGDAS